MNTYNERFQYLNSVFFNVLQNDGAEQIISDRFLTSNRQLQKNKGG